MSCKPRTVHISLLAAHAHTKEGSIRTISICLYVQENFANETLARRQLREWDLRYFSVNVRKKMGNVPQYLSKVEMVVKIFEELVNPRLPFLKMSIIHYDVTDKNTVLEENLHGDKTYSIKSFIDFNDCIMTCTVFDLVVCLYDTMKRNLRPVTARDVVELVGPIISGYNSVLPLTNVELDVLYYLVLARCCVVGVNCEILCKAEPWNDHVLLNAKQNWLLLDELLVMSKEEVDRVWKRSL